MIKKIENNLLSLSFDTEKGRVISIFNKVSEDEYIKEENNAEMFELTCMTMDKKLISFYPDAAENAEVVMDNDEQILKAEYDVNGEFKVCTEIKLKNGCDTLKWGIKVSNNSDKYDIVQVLYPRLRGIYLGNTWKDDVVILPHHAGEKTVDPVDEYTKPAFTGMNRAGVKNDGKVNYRELNYCGLASMTWMYYYDKNSGLYIGSYDDDFPLTGLRFETSSSWIGVAIRKYLTIKRKEKWISKPYAVSVNCRDWHYGAKLYRKWIDRFVRMPENPEYLKDQYVLMNMYKFRREGQIYYKFKDIPYLYDYAKSFGINHFFMAGWNRWGFDQNYPEYHPDLELGTALDLYNGCEYINKDRGIATFYMNARIFDIHSDYFNTLGRKMAIKNYNGDMFHEKYGEYEFTVSCPSDVTWQKYITDTAVWMVKSYNAKGVYLDQLGSAEPFPCYDSKHSHKDIGEFAKGYLKILKDVKDRINKLNPDTFIMIENCGDIYGSYVWGNLTWNGEVRDEFFNLYKYTFPEYVQVNMINPREGWKGNERIKQFYIDVERALVLGSVLWFNPLTNFEHDSESDKEIFDYLKKTVEFRKKLNPYIKNSRFVDTDGINSIKGNIKVTHWVDEEQDIYIIGNNSLRGGSFEVQGDFSNLEMYTIDGEKAADFYKEASGKIEIISPKSRVSFVVLRK